MFHQHLLSLHNQLQPQLLLIMIRQLPQPPPHQLHPNNQLHRLRPVQLSPQHHLASRHRYLMLLLSRSSLLLPPQLLL
jgi:hypothetical protein